jgi:predicted acetyltransferase
MTIKLKKVSQKEAPILRNLYSFYLHDLSKFTTSLDIAADGFFHFKEMDSFWKIDGISPYFIMFDEATIGFILLLERPFLKNEKDFGINDMFILNKYKGKGLGVQAVKELFQQKQGDYFVMELAENKPAVSFWKKVYKESNIEYDEKEEVMDGEACLVQTFTVK